MECGSFVKTQKENLIFFLFSFKKKKNCGPTPGVGWQNSFSPRKRERERQRWPWFSSTGATVGRERRREESGWPGLHTKLDRFPSSSSCAPSHILTSSVPFFLVTQKIWLQQPSQLWYPRANGFDPKWTFSAEREKRDKNKINERRKSSRKSIQHVTHQDGKD